MSQANDSRRSVPDEEVVAYPFGAPEPQPTAPRRRRGLLAAGVVIAVVIVAIGAFVVFGGLRQRGTLQVGDCAEFRPGTGELFRKADCADETAQYVLLSINPDGECRDVPGAVRSMTVHETDFCFGEKGVDPATAINGAREGDCVIMAGDVVERTPCTSPSASHTVTRRVTGVPAADADALCADADMRYGWAWSNVETGREPTRYDVLLCLTSI